MELRRETKRMHLGRRVEWDGNSVGVLPRGTAGMLEGFKGWEFRGDIRGGS